MGKTILNSVFFFFCNYIHENMNLHKYPRFIGEYKHGKCWKIIRELREREITRPKMSENKKYLS